MFSFSLKESKGVDEDGDQEHRCNRKVLQWQNHCRVRHWSVGRRADWPKNPTAKRAKGGHRRNGQSSEENVRLSHNQGCLCVYKCAPNPKVTYAVSLNLLKNFVLILTMFLTQCTYIRNCLLHLLCIKRGSKSRVSAEKVDIRFDSLISGVVDVHFRKSVGEHLTKHSCNTGRTQACLYSRSSVACLLETYKL